MTTAKYDNTDGRLRGRALQARRLRKWTKAAGRCATCGILTDYPYGFELDHIQALVNGGKDTEDQTQVLCISCHETKTNNDLGRKNITPIQEDGWPEHAGNTNARGAISMGVQEI